MHIGPGFSLHSSGALPSPISTGLTHYLPLKESAPGALNDLPLVDRQAVWMDGIDDMITLTYSMSSLSLDNHSLTFYLEFRLVDADDAAGGFGTEGRTLVNGYYSRPMSAKINLAGTLTVRSGDLCSDAAGTTMYAGNNDFSWTSDAAVITNDGLWHSVYISLDLHGSKVLAVVDGSVRAGTVTAGSWSGVTGLAYFNRSSGYGVGTYVDFGRYETDSTSAWYMGKLANAKFKPGYTPTIDMTGWTIEVPFDDGSGTTVTSDTGGITGTLTPVDPSPNWANGYEYTRGGSSLTPYMGAGLSLDGVDDYILATDALPNFDGVSTGSYPELEYTIYASIRSLPIDTATRSVLFFAGGSSGGSGAYIRLEAGGVATIGVGNGTWSAAKVYVCPVTINTVTKFTLRLSLTADSLVLLVNDVVVSSGALSVHATGLFGTFSPTGTLISASHFFKIGRNDSPLYYLPGTVGHFSIKNTSNGQTIFALPFDDELGVGFNDIVSGGSAANLDIGAAGVTVVGTAWLNGEAQPLPWPQKPLRRGVFPPGGAGLGWPVIPNAHTSYASGGQLLPDGAFTLETFLRRSATASLLYRFVSFRAGSGATNYMILYQTSGGALAVEFKRAGVTLSYNIVAIPTTNTWYHLIVTGTAGAYGSRQLTLRSMTFGSSTISAGAAVSVGSFSEVMDTTIIGSDSTASPRAPTTYEMGPVIVYNRVLTDAELIKNNTNMARLLT